MTESSLLNPFAVGPAVGGATGRGFIGREDIFSFINSALASETRAPVLLYGQRRIGKSSILKQIPRHVPEGLVCIFFDLQGTASMKVSQVLYGLGIEIAQKTGVPKPSREECAEENFPTFLSSVIAKAGGEQRLVLLFDEFDVIDERAAGPEIAASRFIPYLAGLSGRFPGIGLVLVVGRKPEELSPAFLGALLKDSIVKPIGRLTEEQTMTLASDLSAGYLRFDTAALDRIYYLTRGHPFCAQALCNVIWNRAITVDRALPVRVTPEAVDAALPQALQLWSNGFNWVYDGMSTPAHRLLLSALADLSQPPDGRPAGLDQVDAKLRSRHLTVDPYEFSLAANDLEGWGVIEGERSGFSFAVPMVGSWIARNRPLDIVRAKTALVNPRASGYYEIAAESLEKNDYNAAIGDFRNALDAFPEFLDAMRGLARALRLRGKAGDLKDAAAVYEKLLTLEPSEPLAPLAEILSQQIEQGGRAKEVADAFARLSEIDAGRKYVPAAEKRLRDAARAHENGRMKSDVEIATILYKGLGDADKANRLRRNARLSAVGNWIIGLCLGFLAFGAGVNSAVAAPSRWMSAGVGLWFGLIGVLFGFLLNSGERRRLVYRALSTALSVGPLAVLGYMFQWHGRWWIVGSIVGGSVLLGATSLIGQRARVTTGITVTNSLSLTDRVSLAFSMLRR